MRQRLIIRSKSQSTTTAILFIVATLLFNFIVAEEEISTTATTKNESELSSVDGLSTTTTTTTLKPILIKSTSQSSQSSPQSTTSHANTKINYNPSKGIVDEGFKPSYEYVQNLKNHATSHRNPSLNKVKRQESVVPLFNGGAAGEQQIPEVEIPQLNQENNSGSDQFNFATDDDVQGDVGVEGGTNEPSKAPRGYYDESPHYRNSGSSQPYGNRNSFSSPLPNDDSRNNEVEVVHHTPKFHTSFVQDEIIEGEGGGGSRGAGKGKNGQYRSSPDKYQYNGHGFGGGSQSYQSFRQDFNQQRPANSFGTSGHPYSFDNGYSTTSGHGHGYGSSGHGNGYSSGGQGQGGYNDGILLTSVPYHSHHHHSSEHHTDDHSSSLLDGLRQSHSEIGLEIGPGVGKALKLLIPSALLLTGVSALFPNRVYVPTQDKGQHHRQKRGVNYTPLNSDENIEYIPANLLRREHRTDDAEPLLYDYDDGTPNPYYGNYVSPRKAKTQLSRPTVLSVEENNNNSSTQNLNANIPEFVAIPTSSPNDEVFPFDLNAPQDVYDAFQFRNKDKVEKEQLMRAKNQNMKENLPRILPNILPLTNNVNNNLQRLLSTTSATNLLSTPGSTQASSPQQLIGGGSSVAPLTSNGPKKIVTPTAATSARVLRKRVKPRPGALFAPTSITEEQTTTTKAQLTPTTSSITSSTTPLNFESKREIVMTTAATHFPPDKHFMNDKNSISSGGSTKSTITKESSELLKLVQQDNSNKFDLSMDGPVMGLLNAAVEHRQDSDVCQRRALCELAQRGTNPNATRFETFLWALANLAPDAFTAIYDIDDIFQAIRDKNCLKFDCANPNLDIQQQK